MNRLGLPLVSERSICINKAADIGPRYRCGKIVVSAAGGRHVGVAHQDDQIRLVVVALQAHQRIGGFRAGRNFDQRVKVGRIVIDAERNVQGTGVPIMFPLVNVRP